MRDRNRVLVMPWFNPEYYAYFWLGLEQRFGRHALRLDPRPFPPPSDDSFHRSRDTFAFVVDGRRYYVSANDHGELPGASALAWADVLGTVNLSAESLGATSRATVVPMGPAFGVKAWSGAAAARLAASFAIHRRPPSIGWRALEATLRRQAARAPIDRFQPSPPTDRRVWYLGAYWPQHPEANTPRVRFLRAASQVLGSPIDGGLVPVAGGPLPSELADLRADGLRHPEYVERLRHTPLAFNHPAVHGCLGWKLGEFLALGKPILTTPVDRVLPEPLQHGIHWWVTEPSVDAIGEAIDRLLGDEPLRRELGRNARTWWERLASPQAMVERLVTS